jgi:hypothetical protein
MLARPTATAALLIPLLGAGCSALPEDHALRDVVGRATRRMVDGVGSVGDALQDASRDLNRTMAHAATLPSATRREVSSTADAAVELVADQSDRLVRFVPRTAAAVGAGAEREVRRVAALTGAPDRLGLDPEQNLAELHRALGALPAVLRTDRTPFPDADDPERTTLVEPTVRRRTWLERILDRMAL